ncbi:MAG: hypothetical protein WAV09_01150 [Minisyncoccia bacterium]
MPPKLTTQQVIGLSRRGPLSTQDVQQLAGGQAAPTNQAVTQRFQGATSQDQSANFGNALRDLLTKAQGMGTANFAQQGFNAQDQQNQRTAYTAPGLIGAAPSVQSGARNAEASALNPTIRGAQQGAQTFSEQLGGFKEGIESTLNLLKEEQANQDKERDDARQLVNQALTTFGSKGFDVIDKKFLSMAGYNPETINLAKDTLKEQELQLKMDKQSGIDALGGLTKNQINTTVNSIAGALDNEPIVKEYNTIKRNIDTYNSLGTSATDDIQRVYTFAKVADPNSAVKEGEYASIEKYSQALLQRVGLKVNRVFTATGILTPEARTAMGNTLMSSLRASEAAYKNVSSEYQRQIDDAYAGRPRQITNYETQINTGDSGGTAGGQIQGEDEYAKFLQGMGIEL